MSNPEQSKSEFFPARTGKETSSAKAMEGEPEEKTVYGSFNDAVEEYKQEIDSGSIDSKEELFSISEPVLLSQKGELFKRYFEKQGYFEKEEEAARIGYFEQKGIAGALNLLLEFNGEKLTVERQVRRCRYPNVIDALDFPSIFDKEKVKRLSQDDPYLAVHFFQHTGSEKFLDLLDKDAFGRYLNESPSLVFQVFLYTRSEQVLDLLDKEAIKKYSAEHPNLAITVFSTTGSERFLDLCDQEAIRKLIRTHSPGDQLTMFAESRSKKIRDLFDKKALFSRERPDQVLYAYYKNPGDELLNLLDKESVKEYLSGTPERMRQICHHAASEKVLDLIDPDALSAVEDLFLSNRYFYEKLKTAHPEVFPDLSPEAHFRFMSNSGLEMIKNGFHENETGLSFTLSEEDLGNLKNDLRLLAENYLGLMPDEKLSTVGAEIEVLNSNEAELRPPLVSQENIQPLLRFFADFSIFTNQKFEEIRKNNPEKFPGYPHSNLHLNFSLTEEQEKIAGRHSKVLEDISYCYSLAYSPFSRLAYLEDAGRDRRNTINHDFARMNPRTTARYQTRFFSLGGSKGEIKSSLVGIGKISFLLPELFNNPDKPERIKKELEENAEIQNRALELKWIIEQVNGIDERRERLSKEISDLKAMKTAGEIAKLGPAMGAKTLEENLKNKEEELKALDQKNAKFRTYFARVQEMLQVELLRFA